MPFEASLYETAHIPGADFLNVSSDLCCASEIIPADQFASLMGRLGIGDDTTVVAYDTEGGRWAARLWWALRYYGHEEAAMLDGGLRAWGGAGGAVETEAPDVEPAVSLPAPDTLNEVFLTVHGPDVLSRMLMRLGLDPAQRVITYRGGGVYGAHDAFVLYLMGFDEVGLYDGSLGEWTSDPSNPVDVVA